MKRRAKIVNEMGEKQVSLIVSTKCYLAWYVLIFTRLSFVGTVPLPIVVAIDVDEPDNGNEFDDVSKSYA